MSPALPTWVHLSSYAFGPESHPGVYRTVLGLAGRAQHVVLTTGGGRYADVGLTASALADLAARGIHVHPIGEAKLLKKPFALAHLLAGVQRRHAKPSALIAHLGNNGWRLLPLGRAADAPVLTVLHGEDAARLAASDEYAGRYRQLFASPGARFLAVAQHLATALVAAGAPPEHVALHHLGVDLEEFRPAPRSGAAQPRMRVALVGRLIEVKGHAPAFEAIGRAVRDGADLELHCFGDGPLRDELQASVAGAGLGERIVLRGALPGGELRGELAGFDLALQPSVTEVDGRAEGLPNALLEAMALGLPALGTRHGGIPEAIVDGETGVLVPERDVAALAAALVRLAADPESRRLLGEAGRRRVEKEFSAMGQGERLATHVDDMASAYQKQERGERRRAWDAAVEGLVEARSVTGRREQLRWLGRIARNRLRGEIP